MTSTGMSMVRRELRRSRLGSLGASGAERAGASRRFVDMSGLVPSSKVAPPTAQPARLRCYQHRNDRRDYQGLWKRCCRVSKQRRFGAPIKAGGIGWQGRFARLVRAGQHVPLAVLPTRMNTPDIALGAIWYLAFLFSTTCHEAAHALVAKWGGDSTAFEGGQVTLNPIPHLLRSPFGMVVMPILSYLFGGWMIGWASAPYDPSWQRRHPHRSAWMALAGPAANFTLMLLSALAIRWVISYRRLLSRASGFPSWLLDRTESRRS
jgi:hypothetical protein